MRLTKWRGVWVLVSLFGAVLQAQEPVAEHGLAFAVVPSLSYSSGEGWEYGGKLFFYQFGDGKIQPYRWHLLINAARSTEEKEDYYAFVDIPHLWGRGSRLDMRVEYKDFGLDEFYGIGNLPEYREEFTEPGGSGYIDEKFYSYKHRWSAGYLNTQWPLGGNGVKLLAGAAAVRTKLETYPLPNQLAQLPQRGMAGGWTNYARVGLVWDRRDQEAAPTSGFWSDLLIEKSASLLGSDYDFARITATDRRYISLFPGLVYAQRLLIEHMPGHPPFYEMAVISGSYQRIEGLGSSRSMRGIPRLLFVGPTKLLINLQLRLRLLGMRILRQDLTFYGHLFADGGKVMLRGDKMDLSHYHWSQGAGLHVQWKKELIGALDIGRSEYNDMAVYLSFGNLF
ncbi:MAG TPA: BamA/TamA family outer membrane protein [bacterium]|nr:BamA/TamA family outer membrane protein [bacterium]